MLKNIDLQTKTSQHVFFTFINKKHYKNMHKNTKVQMFPIATFLPLYMQKISNSDN